MRVLPRLRIQIRLVGAAALGVLALAALAPAGVTAATVVNGDFESGTLSGWQLSNEPSGMHQTGSWFAYSGTDSPLGPPSPPLPPPPAGSFAAITDQEDPGSHILYRDIALEAGFEHRLSMLVYYASNAPLRTPAPNTLSYPLGPGGETKNQQYRVDVIKPTADLQSVDPGDILTTVFATKSFGPQTLAPSSVTADLSAFAGQTVRLRLAEVDNQGILRAGADSISIQSIAPSVLPPASFFSVRKAIFNHRRGTAKLPVIVSGPGSLTAVAAAAKQRPIEPATVVAAGAGAVTISLRPTANAREILKARHRLRVKVALTYTPTGGSASTKVVSPVLKLSPRKR